MAAASNGGMAMFMNRRVDGAVATRVRCILGCVVCRRFWAEEMAALWEI